MVKNKKIIVVIAIALVAAIAAGALIVAFLMPQRTAVYVFNGDYKAGTAITSSMLTPVQADAKIIVAGTATSTSTYFITSENISSTVKTGDVLKSDVSKGKAFMTSDLTSKGGNEIEVRMGSTSIAVTVPVNNVTGVTASLKAESHVNVYVTYSSGGTYLLLENMRVLSVASKDGTLSSATLELNNTQANTVINAANTGTIYMGLVNAEGYVYQTNESSGN